MPQIVRFSRLKPRIVRGVILSLTQHNLLWHVETDDENEILEFNPEECLMRLRFGRFISLAGKIMGEAVSGSVRRSLKGALHITVRPLESSPQF
jgi:DNA-directed RNA polymerase III subunit RPC3